jgi:hypothetical protein
MVAKLVKLAGDLRIPTRDVTRLSIQVAPTYDDALFAQIYNKLLLTDNLIYKVVSHH